MCRSSVDWPNTHHSGSPNAPAALHPGRGTRPVAWRAAGRESARPAWRNNRKPGHGSPSAPSWARLQVAEVVAEPQMKPADVRVHATANCRVRAVRCPRPGPVPARNKTSRCGRLRTMRPPGCRASMSPLHAPLQSHPPQWPQVLRLAGWDL